MLILLVRGKNTKKYKVFRKFVSNLAYSPSLIEDIGFYANRLRGEAAVRKTTLLFIALTIILHSFIVISPADSANASSKQDLIGGGIRDLSDFISIYDRNDQDIKDILSTFGIKREDLENAKQSKIKITAQTHGLVRSIGNNSDNEIVVTYKRSSGGIDRRYLTPVSGTEISPDIDGWTGNSSLFGWFGISKASGGLMINGIPPLLSPLGAPTTKMEQRLSLRNILDDKNFESGFAKSGDRIEYKLSIFNDSPQQSVSNFYITLADILEYTSLIDPGSGIYSNKTETLSWAPTMLIPGETQSRTFVVKVFSRVPVAPRGQSNPNSHDCMMTATFGEKKSIPIKCPLIKNIESMANSLPNISNTSGLIFDIIIFLVVLYFYIRARLMGQEIRILRRKFSKGMV